MAQNDVLPFGDSFMRSYFTSGRVIKNVLGIIPSEKPSDKYIVISSHYDGLGQLNENLYPGADSNASGVAAMLSIARAVRGMRVLGKGLPVNLVFVALDAKQVNMLGAECLYRDMAEGRLVNPSTGATLRRSQISIFVNLDILGGTMSPLSKGNPAYLIMLGGTERQKRMLRDADGIADAGLQLGFDYYGSKDFTDLFFRRVSEQKVFLSNGIPCVMFTSGITLNTNRVQDTSDSLDYEVLRRRVSVIALWIETLAHSL